MGLPSRSWTTPLTASVHGSRLRFRSGRLGTPGLRVLPGLDSADTKACGSQTCDQKEGPESEQPLSREWANRARHVNLQKMLDAGRNSASVKERKPAVSESTRGKHEPAGQLGEIDEQAGVRDRVGPEVHHGLVAEQLALEIEPGYKPEHEGVEEERNADRLRRRAWPHHRAAPRAPARARGRPCDAAGASDPTAAARAPEAKAAQDHGRDHSGVHCQAYRPGKPQRGTAVGEELLRGRVDCNRFLAQLRQETPAADDPSRKNHHHQHPRAGDEPAPTRHAPAALMRSANEDRAMGDLDELGWRVVLPRRSAAAAPAGRRRPVQT